MHRVGRTGRAGQKGLALTLLTPEDEAFKQQLTDALAAQQQQQDGGAADADAATAAAADAGGKSSDEEASSDDDDAPSRPAKPRAPQVRGSRAAQGVV